MPGRPRTPREEADHRLRTWARTTDFEEPLPWGVLGAHIEGVPVPPREELEEVFPRHRRNRFLPYLIVAPQALLTVGVSLIGLGFVVVHLSGGANAPVVGELGGFIFLMAIVITVVPIAMWASTKRRGIIQMLMSAGTAVVSAISFALLSTEPQVGEWSQNRAMTALAVVTGLAASAFLLTFAKAGVKRTLRERRAAPSIEDLWLQAERALVLQVLVKRGLVSTWDVSDLMELPRGTWDQLESLPDGSVRRRT